MEHNQYAVARDKEHHGAYHHQETDLEMRTRHATTKTQCCCDKIVQIVSPKSALSNDKMACRLYIDWHCFGVQELPNITHIIASFVRPRHGKEIPNIPFQHCFFLLRNLTEDITIKGKAICLNLLSSICA